MKTETQIFEEIKKIDQSIQDIENNDVFIDKKNVEIFINRLKAQKDALTWVLNN